MRLRGRFRGGDAVVNPLQAETADACTTARKARRNANALAWGQIAILLLLAATLTAADVVVYFTSTCGALPAELAVARGTTWPAMILWVLIAGLGLYVSKPWRWIRRQREAAPSMAALDVEALDTAAQELKRSKIQKLMVWGLGGLIVILVLLRLLAAVTGTAPMAKLTATRCPHSPVPVAVTAPSPILAHPHNPPIPPTVTLRASRPTAPYGTPVTLVATGTAVPYGDGIRIEDLTTHRWVATCRDASRCAPRVSAMGRHLYRADVVTSTGSAVVWSTPVSVTWWVHLTVTAEWAQAFGSPGGGAIGQSDTLIVHVEPRVPVGDHILVMASAPMHVYGPPRPLQAIGVLWYRKQNEMVYIPAASHSVFVPAWRSSLVCHAACEVAVNQPSPGVTHYRAWIVTPSGARVTGATATTIEWLPLPTGRRVATTGTAMTVALAVPVVPAGDQLVAAAWSGSGTDEVAARCAIGARACVVAVPVAWMQQRGGFMIFPTVLRGRATVAEGHIVQMPAVGS